MNSYEEAGSDDEHTHRRLTRRVDDLERASFLDEASGLYNRSHFLELGQGEFLRSRRYGHNLTLVIATLSEEGLDSDSLGIVILWVCEICRFAGRSGIDVAGRTSQKKVGVWLPETSLVQSFAFVDRLYDNITKMPVVLPSGESLSPSVRLSTDSIRTDDSCFLDLFRRVDGQPAGIPPKTNS